MVTINNVATGSYYFKSPQKLLLLKALNKIFKGTVNCWWNTSHTCYFTLLFMFISLGIFCTKSSFLPMIIICLICLEKAIPFILCRLHSNNQCACACVCVCHLWAISGIFPSIILTYLISHPMSTVGAGAKYFKHIFHQLFNARVVFCREKPLRLSECWL